MLDPTPQTSRDVNVGRDVKVEGGDFVAGNKIVEQNFNLEEYVEKRAEEKFQAKQKRVIPPLLPYQINREIQTKEFRRLCRHQIQMAVPVVSIIHGDHTQAHDTFLERLALEILPNELAINSTQTAVNRFHLPGPTRLQSLRDLDIWLTEQLADVILHSPEASCEDVQTTLAKYPGPVIIDMELLTDDWMKHKRGILEAILLFWNNWPPLAPSQKLFVFLYVTHKIPDTSWVKRQMYLWRKQQIFMQLAHCAFHQYPKLQGAVLTELTNILEPDTRYWARTAAKEFYAGDVEVLLAKIGDLYANHKSLPMGVLGIKLKEFLLASVDS